MSKNPPIRPGLIIKECLERGPMGVSEMHRVYKEKVKEINVVRSKADRIRAATYWSFARQCQFARAMGLIEKEREAPIDDPDVEGLLTIRDGKVKPSTRVIYRLTAAGQSEESAWRNLGAGARERMGWT